MKIKSIIAKTIVCAGMSMSILACTSKDSSPSPSGGSSGGGSGGSSTRTVTFWNPTSGGYGNVSVSMNGSTSTITLDANSAPNCGTSGCANFYNCPTSSMSYTAREIGGSATWSGTTGSGTESCLTIKLY